jgi:hypothetical protein
LDRDPVGWLIGAAIFGAVQVAYALWLALN